MDFFNYYNFKGFHAIEAYWNQGNIIASLLLCVFYILVFAAFLYSFFSCLYLIINYLFERKNKNHENQSNSRNPEDRQNR